MNLVKIFALSGLLLMTSQFTFAAGNAVGTDFIRMLDSGQIVGNSFNIFYQKPLVKGNAAWFGLALANNNDLMLEAAYKAYTGSYMSGVYYQAGIGVFDTVNNDNIGLTGAIGYESSPAPGFLFFGTVKGMVVPNNGFQYTPMLGAMFVF